MVKAFSKFGAKRASVRETRLKEVMVRQLTKESVKKKAAKQPKTKCHTFFATMMTL
jgi:hypothetical protein